VPDDRPDHDPADELYGLPLDRFVPRRNELARELRRSGDRTRAAEVAALRRPTAAAWALDQVARSRPDVVSGVAELGESFRSATDAALDGDARQLREVQARARTFVERVVAAAMGELRNAGRSATDQVQRRAGDTVHAALADPAVAEDLKRGRLAEDHDASGFGFGGDAGARAAAPSARQRSQPARDPEDGAAERRRAREEERERRERERERRRLVERAEQLEERAATAEARARDLRAQADAARAEADAAGRRRRDACDSVPPATTARTARGR
jgi:hypothetical protein